MKQAEVKILEQTIVQACQPLSKEDMLPAMFASLMGYFEAMGWNYQQSMDWITETFVWINKLKIGGNLERVMEQKRKTAIYTH